ncbi:phosphotransacetylase family protein [Limnothrix sp. FACHB-1083]|uniref:DRTGG domain-containing protein n=1 Tax=unclassified Limnothrix TaxID=2632864 RepID=UPI001681B38D|nr:phosphotransacetylase family protein [Limnothrix sp. FACHB-1083]MBD2193220.1 phosphotransacetylase family protein [Limnothrix sp. FACHB-1088]
MPFRPRHLIVGSTEEYSGKSAVLLGLAHLLATKDIKIGYGKPLGGLMTATDGEDADVRLIRETLNLPSDRLLPTLVQLTSDAVLKRLQGEDPTNYSALLEDYGNTSAELVLMEGPASLQEGSLFELSMAQTARTLDASVLLVCSYEPTLTVDRLMAARELLGDRLAGVVLNRLPAKELDAVNGVARPFLESQGIPVLGLLPRNSLLRSVSVGELVRQLDAEVLCCRDRLELMVEDLKIGAMNVNSALKYFRKGNNMAVVTGGDRADIQFAALETSTHCLILTGQVPPDPTIIARAEELEVPVLTVDLDTLTTVEIVDRAFGQVRLQEPIKIQCIRHLMGEHFDLDRLLARLGMEPAAV